MKNKKAQGAEKSAGKNSGSGSGNKPSAQAPVPRQGPFELEGDVLTTNQGLRISDNHNSLKAGIRGPSLLEDFVLREKITSFDHERIPERVVHARGAGAFGVFECTKSMTKYTQAGFLGEVGKKTPVLVRFSTVAGSRGSADTARDVRGFATKFYTDEGNFDLVGNNIPVFFIQDAMKFPDLIHSVKPEPNNEIPQASSAHDTFWDFISLMPESTHMIFWHLSDRAIPRSYRMMEGFGVHTFRFVDKNGQGTFVKYHWKPKLGVHGLVWEEAQLIAGQDPDFHRRDLYEAIDSGSFPEWELGVQLIPEDDEHRYDFDLLDPTKIVPEELVPVTIIGRMTLNRNPDNFFSEIEQAVFHPGHLVPGLDVSNDPLLAGRLFSYTDTQITRLGGPNFHELPVNRPLAQVNNHQRDGFGRQAIPKGRVAYEPNSLAGGCPFHSPEKMKAFVHYPERVEGHKIRARSESFGDHFSQAKLFFDSQSQPEKEHIKNAFVFELSKVGVPEIRSRMLATVGMVDMNLASQVAAGLGEAPPKKGVEQPSPANHENNIIPTNRTSDIAARESGEFTTGKRTASPATSAALSMAKSKALPETRKIALLIDDRAAEKEISALAKSLGAAGAVVELVAPASATNEDGAVPVKPLGSTPSVVYDAVVVFAAKDGYKNPEDVGRAIRFAAQACKHLKTIGVAANATSLWEAAVSALPTKALPGVVMQAKASPGFADQILKALAAHRHWDRSDAVKPLPA